MSETRSQIAFFIGSASAPNIERLLDNLGFMLEDEFGLHLVSTTPEDIEASCIESFQVFGGEYSASLTGGSRALYSYHKENDPDAVVQVTSPPIHGLIVTAIANRFGVPSVYRYSGDLFDAHRLLSGVDKATAFTVNNLVGSIPISMASRHIVLGPKGEQRLTQHGVDPESITILPPSVDIDRVRQTESMVELDVPESRSVALFLGRVHPLKGSRTLEERIPEILSRRSDIQFVFVGSDFGFELPARHQDHITQVGQVPPNRVPEYLALADVLIHPSLTDGLPRAILEALAAGTPVIARDVGEIPWVTDNTFSTDDEFVDLVCQFEELPLDDVSKFSRQSLQSSYATFLHTI